MARYHHNHTPASPFQVRLAMSSSDEGEQEDKVDSLRKRRKIRGRIRTRVPAQLGSSTEESSSQSDASVKSIPLSVLENLEGADNRMSDPEVSDDVGTGSPPERSTNRGAHTIEKVKQVHRNKFNADESGYRVTVNPTPEQIATLDSFLELLEGLIMDIVERASEDADEDDYIQLVLAPPSLERGIGTPYVRKGDFGPDLLLDAVSKVVQSENQFVSDKQFTMHAKVIHQPKGSGLGKNPRIVATSRQAALFKRSMLLIKTEENLCLPAAIVVGKARVDHGSKSPAYERLRKTNRAPCYAAARDFVRAALGGGCKAGPYGMGELEAFQDHIGPSYVLKVFSWAPKRYCVWQGKNSHADAKCISLCFTEGVTSAVGHFDLITKLPGFFDQTGYCHLCDRAYKDTRFHRCLTRCTGCFRPGCPDINGKGSFYCSECKRTFPGRECFNHHLAKGKNGKTPCEQRRRCPECRRIIKSRGRGDTVHVCGEIWCINCKSYVELGHLCYIKPLRRQEAECEQIDEPDNLDNLIIGAEERANGDVVMDIDDHDRSDFVASRYVVFDCEAFAEDETGEHVCDLIVARTDYATDPYFVFEGPESVNDFCTWVFRKDHKGWCFIAHYAKKYDNYFVINWLVQQTNFKLKVILNGGALMLLAVPNLKIRFIDSINFLQCSLAKMPTVFGLQDKLAKTYFPHRFHSRQTLNYRGPMPAAHFYDPDQMSPGRRTEFVTWYAQQIENDVEFDLQADMLMYCKADVDILRECCLLFRELFFNQTSIDPFAYVTIASACNAVFRKQFLRPDTIAIIPPTGYHGNDKFSYLAMLWLGWLEHTTGKRIAHARNGGEYTLVSQDGSKMKLDGAVVLEKEAFEFLGCYIHGCVSCYAGKTFNPTLQTCMSDLYQRWKSRKAQLTKEGWHVTHIWACEFARQLKADERLKDFAKNVFGLSEPLNPREAFFGGRTNAVVLYYLVTQSGEKIQYYDINSLYPWCNKACAFPIKHPEIILSHQVDYGNLTQYFGLVKATVLPPTDLYHPILPARIGQKLMFCLCMRCAQDQNHDKTCSHTAQERAISGTWVTHELFLALNHGYKILNVEEIWHFPERSSDLFSGYINTFLKTKQEARGFGNGVVTAAEKQAYIQDFYEKENVWIDESKVEKNTGLYQLAKTCLNSFWGKFGQRSGLPNVEFMDDEWALWKMLKSERYDVMDVCFPSEKIVQVQYREDCDFISPGLNTNVVIAAFTTAYARVKLWESLQLLGERVLYFDTDSVVFVEFSEDQPRPPLGDHLGVFKNEFEEGNHAVEYVGAGPKNYGFRTVDGEVSLKVRGFTLNYLASSVLNFRVVRDMVIEKNWNHRFPVLMGSTISRDKKTWTLYTRELRKVYKFSYNKRRMCDNLVTVPWGYTGSIPQITRNSLARWHEWLSAQDSDVD